MFLEHTKSICPLCKAVLCPDHEQHACGVVTTIERHDQALLDTIDRVVTRLRAARLFNLAILQQFDIARGIELAQRAADAVVRRDAGFLLPTASKP